ncbi:hypothetical protein CHU95_11120 [Niveispirillum lacus]|uniref:Mannosylglycerate hydrolase MGH1-like glycoside hydrolase domain-containing protein n=1 Tax=Niveispirillum lacus TaxID=1981099 RepID=A0A255YZ84_9PROT|nr:hypothetical protein [Niveispirillum lacus]OYQ34557.1 hypothetical protein CHU95_11120 [Niveispirillum lacus]
MPRSPRALLTFAALSLLGAGAGHTAESQTYAPYAAEPGGTPATVSVSASGTPGTRVFHLHSTAPQRDNTPSTRIITENGPFTRTGDLMFDALFAQAVDDARLASVTSIKDEWYNNRQPIPCPCFETGEKWNYVWTRDLSYALDLGLAGLDPQRAVNSLLFKTGTLRPGVPVPPELPPGSTQIVQDTGSGGSWPVSTDRTTWALGAEAALANLHGANRTDFARKAFDALRGTLEADRVAVYDARSGLYKGEHSFLDWREQSYAPWVRQNLSALADSKALSTNVTQYRAQRLAARLAREFGEMDLATRYDGWADALARAIDGGFWDARAGMYATYTSADLTPALIGKYDLLGNALAVLSGIAPADRARSIFDRYPFAPFGPSVVWPQAPGEYVYHNRAQWPFVTAYAVRAAAKVGHVAAVERGLAALERAAALNLSNMENLEWLTGKAQFDDGPEINSRRQLWSVAAYYGMVVETIFGWHAGPDGIRIAPTLTGALRDRFTGTDAVLSNLEYAGRKLDLALILPPQSGPGALYPVASVHLNGTQVTGLITADQLSEGVNRIDIRFAPSQTSASMVTNIPLIDAVSHAEPRAFMPWTPSITAAQRNDAGIRLDIAPARDKTPVRYNILRDGVPLAQDVTGQSWTDPAPPVPSHTACYSVVAVHVSTRISSQPSAPACLRGDMAQTIAVDRKAALGQTLDLGAVTLSAAGRYVLGTLYDNHTFALNTGVTNAVKRLVLRAADGTRHSAIIQMPHIEPEGDKHPIRPSTRAVFDLPAGTYQVVLEDFFNMSGLSTNMTYSAPGGSGGPVNEALIAALTIDKVAGP